ncbi:TRAP-type C4-dicarboxylate transport system, small permease component [Solibacillus silvestris StLB046]|uniref:TRAP-type C4-dicarboxylate transport system, small permease component n=1 Tax=Solibacillus silvestris (strain StLB046) TaxID=1002809 RepID=F2F5L8_SOLSS|nr:TRAP transporter small permease [Solibacillus silvestris]BAK16551.1 TRAP-type C4-dicarboxylate transport system, small permease component [Solibacillus silvestris StLB046]
MVKLVEGINKVVHIALIALMVVLVVSVFCQITLRFFNYSIAWTEELSRYSMIWMTFLGAAYALAKRAHIGMELFVDRTEGLLKQVLIVLTAAVCLVFFVLMVVKGYELSMRVMDQPSAVMQVPMGIVYSVIPISGIILVVNLFYVTVKQLKGELS